MTTGAPQGENDMDTRSMLARVGKYGILACVFALFAIPGARAGSDHEYAGVKKCSICHKTPAQGEQFPKWQASKHSKAFETLGTPEAKEMALKLNVADPQKDGKCLKCHSTAYGHTEAQVTQVIPLEEGVSCESCHGAGKDYLKLSVMKDVEAAKAAGLNIPDEKTCLGCHNSENPFNKPFNYQERLEKIKHSIPKK
jgi:Cytochrome c554 and c-prime